MIDISSLIFLDRQFRNLYVKEGSVHARAPTCLQTVVQPHWMAECKMTILNEEILFHVLKKF